MPELPEVETVKKTLANKVVGKTITNVFVNKPKLIKNFDAKSLINLKINKVTRTGKYLVFHLSNNNVLLSHLRMEGKFLVKDKNYELTKHDHVIFSLSDKSFLIYNDTRMFGTFHMYKESEYKKSKQIAKLGLEPISSDLTAVYLQEKISKKNRAIKTVLLDQTIISGIGNIYADEILFASQINPLTFAKNITIEELKRIVKASKSVISRAIEMNGSTIDSYKFDNDNIGSYQNELKVHTRKDKNCLSCKSKILKTKVNGRGTYYCPTCQKGS